MPSYTSIRRHTKAIMVLVSIYQVKTLYKVQGIQEIACAARVRHDFEPESGIY